jgi:hypothetical protein
MISTLEYQIISDVLIARLPPEATGEIVIATEPMIESNFSTISIYKEFGVFARFPSLDAETILSLLEKERQPDTFKSLFTLPRMVTLLDEDEAKRIFRERGGWTSFYEKFPKSAGRFFFSRVGLNPSRNQAILHFGRQWHGRAGSGCIVFLEDSGNGFVEVGKMGTWMS